MYRGILGDCFLLSHWRDGKPTRILIDCGVLQHSGGDQQIRNVAADIKKETGGHLSLLVVTHEHADHLSGFSLASDVFFDSDFKIDMLWLAWTERHDDAQAVALRARFKQARLALGLALQVAESGAFDCPALNTVAGLANFLGPMGIDTKSSGIRTTGQILVELKRKVGPEKTRYLEPGEVREAAPGLQAYVLGPPRTGCRLTKAGPSGGSRREVYMTDYDEALAVESAARAALARLKVAEGSKGSEAHGLSDHSPFARRYHRTVAATEQESDRLQADKAALDPRALYFKGEANRRIETDWTTGAEVLALKMDSDTNNTSVALAFELDDNQVLLFPGDAQVGNWLSWGDQTYKPPGADAASLTIDDLLRRVTLYKVGHHASHNATLRDLGLEKMTDPRLVAMIPVVERVARAQGKKGWQMPFPDLYERLKHRTSQRVVRGDGVQADERDAFLQNPTNPTDPATVNYENSSSPLWVEVCLFGAS
jgi:hypothetical protein